jgi:hypothetical protein
MQSWSGMENMMCFIFNETPPSIRAHNLAAAARLGRKIKKFGK